MNIAFSSRRGERQGVQYKHQNRLDQSIGKIEVFTDIGRVLLNLLNNAFCGK
jgi:hypothetical protein